MYGPEQKIADNPLVSPDNVVQFAAVSASSTHADYSAEGAIDGSVDGFPRAIQHEWASNGESDSALIRLTWSTPQTIDRVWLFDRPNTLDQITGGMLLFGDDTTLKTGVLPDDARKGLEVSLKPKTVKWLVFLVTSAKTGSPNIGLSEIVVFATKK